MHTLETINCSPHQLQPPPAHSYPHKSAITQVYLGLFSYAGLFSRFI